MGKWLDIEDAFAAGKTLGGHRTKKDFLETAAIFYQWALERTYGTEKVEGGFEVMAMKSADGCGGVRLRHPDIQSLRKQ